MADAAHAGDELSNLTASQPTVPTSAAGRDSMKLSKLLCAVPVIGFVTMAAFADDATPPPAGGPMPACRQDVQTLCPGVQRGGGRIMECLKSHETDVSAG